jgi:hypothetical protein
MAAAVIMAAEIAYQRGRWFISSVSEIRIIWNITSVRGHHILFCKHLDDPHCEWFSLVGLLSD